ncbi:MAG: hypothetical protein WAX04_04615, partial [Oscillospiraceae bacterium]
YFNSVFINDDGTLPNFPSRFPSGPDTPAPKPTIDDIDVTPNKIENFFAKLKSNSAAGPDALPPILFKMPLL